MIYLMQIRAFYNLLQHFAKSQQNMDGRMRSILFESCADILT
jgi:hypothetical protein